MKWTLFLFVLMGQCRLMICKLYEYHYVEENQSWFEAQMYCRQYYTDLATVCNMTDIKRLSESTGNTNEAWIGLFRQPGVNRMWYWSLYGVEFNKSETNWAPGEPERLGFEVQNCVIIWKNFTWGGAYCTSNKSFLCYDENETSDEFYLINDTMNWLEAQSYCRNKHTDLVSGWKQLIDPKLKDALSYVDRAVFIGLFRDFWRWSDGSSFSFRYSNLQFNTLQYENGPCIKVVFNNEGRWLNDDCIENKPFICYDDKVILITEKMNWEEALYYCRDHYHDLVTITSLDEQRWVQEKVKNALTPLVWMGLRYTCTLDFWFWVSDEVVTYKNWVSGGPQDDCDMSGAMDTGGQHQWVKTNDAEELNFLCSKV